METCPACYNDTLTTHGEQGSTICQGCSPTFCTECYYGARYSCAYFQETNKEVPEYNWVCAESYMNSNPDKKERVVRSGPRRKCMVVRIGTALLRRTMYDGEVISDVPVPPTEACRYCGAYDRRYTEFASAYQDGFACTECANGILGKY